MMCERGGCDHASRYHVAGRLCTVTGCPCADWYREAGAQNSRRYGWLRDWFFCYFKEEHQFPGPGAFDAPLI